MMMPSSGRMVLGMTPVPAEPPDPQSELDRLLNDPEVPMQASRVWALADEVAVAARAVPA
jgi:hypothetical protein